MSKTIKITDTNGVCYIRVADIGAVIAAAIEREDFGKMTGMPP